MASREEWCAEKQSQLLHEDLRISTLQEIKDYFSSIPNDEANRTADLLQLPLVFDCLNDSNKEQVDLACDVLSLCLGNLSLGESTNRYAVSLERALLHPSSNVKLMALKEIQRNAFRGEVINDLCKRNNLLINIVQSIGDDELSIAKKASEIVQNLGLNSVGIGKLFQRDVLDTFNRIMSKNEVARLRVYEVMVDISKESEDGFKLFCNSGLISHLLNEADNNDILVKMNTLEIFTKLGLCKHGFDFLESNGVINKLLSLLNDETALNICEPGILRFFGNITYWKPLEMISKYPQIFKRLILNLKSDNLTIVGVSLDTLGHIGSNNEGKVAYDNTGEQMVECIRILSDLADSLPTEFRIRAMQCFADLLYIEPFKADISAIARKWYQLFNENTMDVIVKYANNPFAELRQAGLGILKAIAMHSWGQEEIKNFPGLIEFLLDRNVEHIKESKELKYEIVKVLSLSAAFDHLTVNRLQKFVKEGPFYVETVTEVAIEGNE